MATAICDEPNENPSRRMLADLGIVIRDKPAAEPEDPQRDMCVRHLRTLADALESPDAYIVLVRPKAARLLFGEGAMANYWTELSFILRCAMVAAAEALERHGCEDCFRQAASLMRVAADRIGGPVG